MIDMFICGNWFDESMAPVFTVTTKPVLSAQKPDRCQRCLAKIVHPGFDGFCAACSNMGIMDLLTQVAKIKRQVKQLKARKK